MFSSKKIIIIAIVLQVMALAGLSALGKQELSLDNSFDAVHLVKIQLASSKCIFQKGTSDKIEIHLDYTYPEDQYTPQFSEQGGVLILSEKFSGNSVSGRSTWTITLPEKTEIHGESASGDFRINGLINGFELNTASGSIFLENTSGKVNLNTASGSIDLNNHDGDLFLDTASGDIKLRSINGNIEAVTASGSIVGDNLSGNILANSASGRIRIDSSRGVFTINSSSGDSNLTNIHINGASTFSGASGDVFLELAVGCDFDLNLSSASGDVELDYKGNPFSGKFTFTAREDRGEIESKHSFDSETTFSKGGNTYMKKIFTEGADSPEIVLSTASGKVILK